MLPLEPGAEGLAKGLRVGATGFQRLPKRNNSLCCKRRPPANEVEAVAECEQGHSFYEVLVCRYVEHRGRMDETVGDDLVMGEAGTTGYECTGMRKGGS